MVNKTQKENTDKTEPHIYIDKRRKITSRLIADIKNTNSWEWGFLCMFLVHLKCATL